MKILKTNNKNKDFNQLVKLLDSELAIYDGDQHEFYDQFNGIEDLKHVVLLIDDNLAVACGAIKHFDDDTVEIKRMYVREEYRGKGNSTKILSALEVWAKELNYSRIILETGKRQIAAVNLYRNKGYIETANYDPYVGVDNSLCFEKVIKY